MFLFNNRTKQHYLISGISAETESITPLSEIYRRAHSISPQTDSLETLLSKVSGITECLRQLDSVDLGVDWIA